ncbi:MAG: VWA domain-containing protein [Terriglobales bacterium]
MRRRANIGLLGLLAAVACLGAARAGAQATPQGSLIIRAVVNVVELNVAVTDSHGRYVTGLRPSDFAITEDGIPETIATFEEGNAAPFPLAHAPAVAHAGAGHPPASAPPPPGGAAAAGSASVFVLMDTSNYMYTGLGFVHAQDAIVGFIRSLTPADRVAFYAYSRNLSRAAPLTSNRMDVIRGVRSTTNGDAAGLYDALLLTLRDAGAVPGRKVAVVFSNGPDNASMVPPDDISELAQSEGIPVYVVSTRHAEDNPVFATAMKQLSAQTGGEAFFSRHWQNERVAFATIREDLEHLFFLSYYPKPNANHGWRSIQVRLVGKRLRHDHVRTRDGYRLRPLPLAGVAPLCTVGKSNAQGCEIQNGGPPPVG